MSIWTIYFINLKVYEKKSLQKIGCIIFSVGERKNSLPTLNFFAKK